MTTIALRAGLVCSDTQVTADLMSGTKVKILKVGTDVIGAVGSAATCSAFTRWGLCKFAVPSQQYNNFKEVLETDDDFLGIHIQSNGFIQEYECSCIPHAYKPYRGMQAWGTGGQVALGAMLQGADPALAVQIAAEVDPYTNTDITEVEVG